MLHSRLTPIPFFLLLSSSAGDVIPNAQHAHCRDMHPTTTKSYQPAPPVKSNVAPPQPAPPVTPYVAPQAKSYVPRPAPRTKPYVAPPQPAPQAKVAKNTAPTRVMQYIVDQTNIIRSHHQAPPVVWDQNLANAVQHEANRCPGFDHFDLPYVSSWQNLASGSPCDTKAGLIQNGLNCVPAKKSEPYRFYEHEEPLWNYNTKTCRSSWEKCGHFVIETQPGTQKMGCAMSICQNGRPISHSAMESYGKYDINVWCDYTGKNMNKNPVINRPISPVWGALQKNRNQYLY